MNDYEIDTYSEWREHPRQTLTQRITAHSAADAVTIMELELAKHTPRREWVTAIRCVESLPAPSTEVTFQWETPATKDTPGTSAGMLIVQSDGSLIAAVDDDHYNGQISAVRARSLARAILSRQLAAMRAARPR